mmetsp:Transcript_19962/g.30382  ORF Transcript_19962/g.30382 Transcript_19962/m.30382 type:complete len:425 (-) Transcript_19962:268-1542(-)
MIKASLFKLALFGVLISIVLKIRNSGPPAELNETKMPPWPIFKAAVAVNKFLTLASEKSAPPHQRILSLSMAYTQSAIIYAIDAIPNENNDGSGGATCEQVAQIQNLDIKFTCRFMVAASTMGILKTKSFNSITMFFTTTLGDLLRSDHPKSLRDNVLYLNQAEKISSVYAGAEKSIKTGNSGFFEVYGKTFFDWLANEDNDRTKEFQQVFDAAMSSTNRISTRSILADLDLSNAQTVCDVGGGRGNFLIEIARKYPNIPNFVLFDLPGSVAHALPELLASNRTQIFSGSFFDLPKLQLALQNCSFITLKHILHNWDDDHAATIISNIIQAVTSKKEQHHYQNNIILAIADFIQPDIISESPMSRAVSALDIQMLATQPGARERSYHDFLSIIPHYVPRDSISLIPLRGPYGIIQIDLHLDYSS